MLGTSSVIPRVLWIFGFIVVYSFSCFCGSKSLLPAYSSPSERSSWRQFASVFTAAPIRQYGAQPLAFGLIGAGTAGRFFAKTLPQTFQACALQPIHGRLTQIELLSGEGFG